MAKNNSSKKTSIISQNVKKYKKEKGFSKSDLVRETGLDYHTIAKIESGRTLDPRISTVKKIADVLEIKLDKLFN